MQKPYLTTSHENLFLNAVMKFLILLRMLQLQKSLSNQWQIYGAG